MTIRTIVCGCAVIVFSGAAGAQGSFDFDDIPGIDQQPAIVIDINPVMVGIIRSAMANADPEAAELLGRLRSLKLRVYHDGDKSRQFSSFIDDVTQRLQKTGWQAVISAQDEDSKVRWYMQMAEDEISGMTIMATDSTEAYFLNIDGSITTDDLGRIMSLPAVKDALGSFRIPPAPGPAAQPPGE